MHYAHPEVTEDTGAQLSLSRIALTCAAGLAAWLILTELLSDYLRRRGPFPEGETLVDGALAGVLLTLVLFALFRSATRQNGEARHALQQAFHLSINAVCICRVSDGTFLKVNQAFSELTGYSAGEVLGTRVREAGLWQAPQQFPSLVRVLQQHGEVQDFEINLVSREGTPKVGLLTASMIEHQGEPAFLAIIRDVSELRQAEQQIEQLSYYDADTGLANQNLLLDRLNQLISLNSRDHRPTAVIYVGLDGFKGVIDALGRSASNEVVGQLARRLGKALRHSDTVARLHRDELGIALGGELREADLDQVIAKIGEVLAQPVRTPAGDITVSASLGIACFPADGLTGELLLQHSHAAMNQAREEGDRFQYFSVSMNSKALARLRFESGMNASLEAGEFFLCYQPKYAQNGSDLTGMEALVRWRHLGEVIPPARFIPFAEESGMIVKLGEWVLREACRQNKSWQEQGFPPLQVSVNISARQLRDNDFVGKVEAVLAESGLDPRYLELEITESAIMSISEEMVLKLLCLKQMGISISIDDFGTGYSSLSYLKNLPVDKIKIDRSFVMDIVSDSSDAAIVDAIISIARALDLCVIAEGVESKGQLDYLISRHCTEFQGYYFSRPLSAEQFAALLKTRECAVNPAGCCPEQPEAPRVGAAEPGPARSLYLVASKSAARCEQMGDVAQAIAPVSPLDRITSVLGRFQREMDLKVLPVVEDGAVVGMVNRSTFLEEHIIGRHGFGAHINHSKKIRDLMEPLAISLDAAMPVEEAARMLQPMIGTLRIDNVCITKNGAYAGVLDVNRYLKAMTDIQIVLAKGANPLTGLPGNTSIEREISSRLEANVPFDIAYLDIDNFKPFNDHYGFQKGDEVIRKLAEIMETVAASVPAEKTFCGHIGGDDFILITESLKAERLSQLIIAAFEAERSIFHGTRDCALGGYRAVNRKGEPENFSLISLSVGIVNTSLSQVGTYAKLASLSTEVKKAAKKRPGSSIVVDGRRSAGERSANGLEVA
jgi:diguanylate cyclase (GGDEF)-like protein/PAS domain S-box-containing protein